MYLTEPDKNHSQIMDFFIIFLHASLIIFSELLKTINCSLNTYVLLEIVWYYSRVVITRKPFYALWSVYKLYLRYLLGIHTSQIVFILLKIQLIRPWLYFVFLYLFINLWIKVRTNNIFQFLDLCNIIILMKI